MRAIAFVGIGVIGLIVGLAILARIAWADTVEASATSQNGFHAEAWVDGAPLSGGTRVLIWSANRPHWQIFGCKMLESDTTQPIQLSWNKNQLIVDHAYNPNKLIETQSECGKATVMTRRILKPYS